MTACGSVCVRVKCSLTLSGGGGGQCKKCTKLPSSFPAFLAQQTHGAVFEIVNVFWQPCLLSARKRFQYEKQLRTFAVQSTINWRLVFVDQIFAYLWYLPICPWPFRNHSSALLWVSVAILAPTMHTTWKIVYEVPSLWVSNNIPLTVVWK